MQLVELQHMPATLAGKPNDFKGWKFRLVEFNKELTKTHSLDIFRLSLEDVKGFTVVYW